MQDRRDTVLMLEDVSRHYQQGDTVVKALDHVDFTLHRGEFVVLAGPSGSGKTTLLNVAAGLDTPTEGKVLLAGQDLSELSRTEKARLRLSEVGFVFQAYNLIPVLTAEENAEFILLLQKIPNQERKHRIRSILEQVGLKGLEHRRPGELSGGQQQRVAVARAIAAEPALVLADEPTANLDTETAFDLLDVMEKLNRENEITFLFSTHDPRVMERAHRVVRMLDGRIDSDEKQQNRQMLG